MRFALVSLPLLVFGTAALRAQTMEIPFHADSKIRFATREEAAGVLGNADPWVRALSPFDRCARMQQAQDPGQEAFLEFAAAQALDWPAEQADALRAVVESAGQRIERLGLRLNLPSIVPLVRTSGSEEGHAPYTRGNAIVLPAGRLDQPAEQLEVIFLHELFHVMSRHDPSIRERLYGIIGYKPCSDVPFPDELLALKMTNPDAPHRDSCIEVEVEGAARTVTPVLHAGAAYTDGGLFDAMVFKLMAVEGAGATGDWRPARADGRLVLLDPGEVSGFFEKIGRNTRYVIHPEETMADNFAFAVVAREDLPNPEILTRLLEALRR